MELQEVIDRYCDRHGLRLVKGKKGDNDPAPLLAYLIMDSAQAEYMKNIAVLNLTHDDRDLDRKWRADYHLFNSRLFSCLTEEQKDYVVDLMDEYEHYITNDVMMVRIATMNLFNFLEFDNQKVIASLLLCNVFAQVAQDAWGAVFRTGRGKPQVCMELNRLRNYSHKLINSVIFLPRDVNPNADEKLVTAINNYIRKTTKWLQTYDDRKR